MRRCISGWTECGGLMGRCQDCEPAAEPAPPTCDDCNEQLNDDGVCADCAEYDAQEDTE